MRFQGLRKGDRLKNALQKRIAKTHCKNALQKRIAKTHCKNALQKCIAKTHCQICRVNDLQPVIIETLIGLIKAKCFLIMACRWKM
jgi:hypothetical protein